MRVGVSCGIVHTVYEHQRKNDDLTRGKLKYAAGACIPGREQREKEPRGEHWSEKLCSRA